MEEEDKPNFKWQQDLLSSSSVLTKMQPKHINFVLFEIFHFIAGKNVDLNDDHWTLYT